MSQGAWLFNGHGDMVDLGLIKADIGDLTHQTFNEHWLSALNVGDDSFRDGAIVDGIVDVVRTRCGSGVNPHHNVDTDVLLIDAFVGIDADDPRHHKILDEHLIQRHAGEGNPRLPLFLRKSDLRSPTQFYARTMGELVLGQEGTAVEMDDLTRYERALRKEDHGVCHNASAADTLEG